jgi:hypothetical protein
MSSKYYEHAVAFLQAFKLDSFISHGEFDKWAIEKGLLKKPSSTEIDSDAWVAHIQRRHRLRANFNYAASSLQMKREAGLEPYTIDRVGTDHYHIRRLHVAVITNKTTERIRSYCINQGKSFGRFMVNADWSRTDPNLKQAAEDQIADLIDFGEEIDTKLIVYNRKCARLANRLQKQIEDGTIRKTPEIKQEIEHIINQIAKPDESEEEDEQ